MGCAAGPTDYEGVIDAVVIDEGGLGQGIADDGSLEAFGSKVISLHCTPVLIRHQLDSKREWRHALDPFIDDEGLDGRWGGALAAIGTFA